MTEQQAAMQKMAMEHQAKIQQMEQTYADMRARYMKSCEDNAELRIHNKALAIAMRTLLKTYTYDD